MYLHQMLQQKTVISKKERRSLPAPTSNKKALLILPPTQLYNTCLARNWKKSIERTRKLMQEAAKKLDFIEAAQYRDELLKMEDMLKEKV